MCLNVGMDVYTWVQVPQSPEKVPYSLESKLQAVVSYPAWVHRTKFRSSVKALLTFNPWVPLQHECTCTYLCVCMHTHSIKYTFFSTSSLLITLEELFKDFCKIMYMKLANASNFQSGSLPPIPHPPTPLTPPHPTTAPTHAHIALHHYPWVWSYHRINPVGTELKVLQIHTASSTISNILLSITLKTKSQNAYKYQPFCWYYLPLNSSLGRVWAK